MLALVQGGSVTLVVAAYYGWLVANGAIAGEARALAFIVLVTANAASGG